MRGVDECIITYFVRFVTIGSWQWVSRFLLSYGGWCDSLCQDLKVIKQKIDNHNA